MKTTEPDQTRLKARIRGAVQGVGFRPFIFRLATELELAGWVNNSAQGVFLELEGPRTGLEKFLLRIGPEKPPRSFIQSLEVSWLDPAGYQGFEIRESDASGGKTALVLPDIATCPDCLAEILDPNNRRYRYPFTNCTNCGPRFSIIESLPYDRANTSMKAFRMCARCQAEYDDPQNRRFHAQPNACPDCGPHLELWQRLCHSEIAVQEHSLQASGHMALLRAAEAIRDGKIVAVKGLGGFHLVTDARNGAAVRRLRERKHREEKPFALMFPSPQSIRTECDVGPLEERLLASPESPIVLLRRRGPSQISNLKSQISRAVAPGNPCLGVMLPYTPLHHLLMVELGFPVVATSGNLSDEPICIDEQEALPRLGGIAELFLVHNRPIVRHVDDSIVRVILGRELVLRRARGYAPLPIPHNSQLTTHNSQTVLAVGAHLKNAVALSVGEQAFISQHIGDLETDEAHGAFRRVITDFEALFETNPAIIAADAHPDYLSTKYACEAAGPANADSSDTKPDPRARPSAAHRSSAGPRLVRVQHHVAHVFSCMAENEVEPPVLGVSWDGTGYGLDGTVWGGEFFLVTESGWQRVAHFRTFRLPGGEQAVKEPRRTALGLLYEMLGSPVFSGASAAAKPGATAGAGHTYPPLAAFAASELTVLQHMLERGVNSPKTSSAGRLFDAVAALTGLRQKMRFEGQAAMELEFALDGIETDDAYSFATDDGRLQIDWTPLVEGVLADVNRGLPIGLISAKFHNALVEVIVAVARRFREQRVVLTGGCFQNRYLSERSVRRLREEGFRPYWHQRVPPNDGGIALGQIIAALRQSP